MEEAFSGTAKQRTPDVGRRNDDGRGKIRNDQTFDDPAEGG
jgi:hypothetical protein